MRKFKMLVLTDHSNHSKENSLYALVQALRRHPSCGQIDIASRGNEINQFFFKKMISKGLFVSKADEKFKFYANGQALTDRLRREAIGNYDVVFLRLPPPLSSEFLGFLTQEFPQQLIINAPLGIYETGSKEFLLNFPNLCPPMQLCKSLEAVEDFKNQFPIVLKPFRDYGGRGIIRIDGDTVWDGQQKLSFTEFAKAMAGKPLNYLGVKFLKNVGQGDKRIIVVDGRIMGASLRLPAKDSWLCNVAAGGSSHAAEVEPEEIAIVETINPILSKMGIIMYGVDTLVGDEGKRVLSEINTTSIGGLPQLAKQQNKPIVEQTADIIWQYVIEQPDRLFHKLSKVSFNKL